MSMPRNFKLLAEYDAAIGKEGKDMIKPPHVGYIQYGLDESRDDMELHYWQGLIIGPQDKPTGDLMYNFTVFASDSYPAEAPSIRFTGVKMTMPAVDSHGNVNLNRLSPSFRWTADKDIADALMAVRSNMCDDSVSKASYAVRNDSYT